MVSRAPILLLVIILSINVIEQRSVSVDNQNTIPPIVSIHYKDEHICSGTIVAKKFVITAATCLCTSYLKNYSDNLKVHLGPTLNNSTQVFKTSIVDCHMHFKDFHPYGSIKDIAVIKLDKKVHVKNRQIIKLHDKNFETENKCNMFIWKNKAIHKVPHIIIEHPNRCCSQKLNYEILECKKLCSTSPNYPVEDIDRGMPLVCGDKLLGIFSWNDKKTNRYVYTNVLDHISYFDYVNDYL